MKICLNQNKINENVANISMIMNKIVSPDPSLFPYNFANYFYKGYKIFTKEKKQSAIKNRSHTK